MLQSFNKKKLGIALAASLAVVLSILMIFTIRLAYHNDTFYKGISIEGIDVSGKTRHEVSSLVAEKSEKLEENTNIVLSCGDLNWNLKLRDISLQFLREDSIEQAYSLGRNGNIFQRLKDIIGFRNNGINFTLMPVYDKNKLKAQLQNIKKQIDLEAKNAEVIFTNGNISFKNEIIGRSLDVDKNANLIENHIVERKFDNIKLEVDTIIPYIVEEDINGINGILSAFNTQFNPSDTNRTFNIRLACEKIKNIVLRPGDVFSMSDALGPRTIENGYKEAPVIFKNELIQGAGGGVCQVTTTLYGAVLKSKMQVVQRTHHSLPLGYVDPGQDATIAEDYIDFKFKNNRDYPVCIVPSVQGNTLNVKILGKKEKDDELVVKLRSHIVDEISPGQEELIVDNTLPDDTRVVVKEAKNGIRVVVYRETYNKSGELIDKEKISEDIYKPVKAQVKVNQATYDSLNNIPG